MPQYLTFADAGIEVRQGATGNTKTHCPNCHSERRNKTDKSLSVNVAEGVWNCHHCGWKGHLTDPSKAKPAYVVPTPTASPLSPKATSWFNSRGISTETLAAFKIGESMEWMPERGGKPAGTRNAIQFPYFKNGQLANVKFRDGHKCFKLVSGAELLFFNLDAIRGRTECLICEGEIDALTFYEASYFGAVSVPNGASRGSQKLEYLDNCWQWFEGMEKIYLATDGDEPGLALREELARRLGKERCWLVSYPDGCKDANEVLLAHGKAAVKELLENAQPYPLEGIVSDEEMGDGLLDVYENGLPEGDKIGYQEFDELISFGTGVLTTITGIPGSGKSEFIDQIMVRLAERQGRKFVLFSAEKQPAHLHAISLITKYIGRPYWGPDRMTKEELRKGQAFVAEHFFFIKISEVDTTIDGILAKARELVLRRGVWGLLIDPYNYIEHKIPKGYTETQYISELLTKLRGFLVINAMHGFLVAHPTKIQKDPVSGKYAIATLYNISGSAHFFNKTDNGFTVYRDFETGIVWIYVQKIRWWWHGQIGQCAFTYQKGTGKYFSAPLESPPPAKPERPQKSKAGQVEDKPPQPALSKFPDVKSNFEGAWTPQPLPPLVLATDDDDEPAPF